MSLENTDILDIYAVTEKGTAELKAGTTQLPVDALKLLVMFDGKSSVAEIARRTEGFTSRSVAQVLPMLLENRFIEIVRPGEGVSLEFESLFVPPPRPAVPSAGDDADKVRAEAEKATASLNANGYYVNIARQAPEKRSPANNSKYSVLIVEDNEPLLKVLSILLRVEGFEARSASNRDQIVAALRTQPFPDVILLDVGLGDTNGFDVLESIRAHPQFKDIPVIMLTALASRKDVLRGLAGGADGYMTKPIEHEVLTRGLKAVLGLD
jgi:two-component system OmpR family response regulator